jgi:mannose-6-phosphate isomerase-like protein (cupin superfamily)
MRIVNKPWGFEEIWAESPRYVGKFLHINAGHRLSRQYHCMKDETIRVMSGHLLLELGDTNSGLSSQTMTAGQTFRIVPGTIHRFCAPDDDVVLAEVSTPELDDVIRISDDYVR